MNLRPRRRPVPSIPIVSLIDIMVILLIFFIATTTFREKKMEVKINLPESQTMGEAAPESEVRTTLAITEKQDMLLDGLPVKREELASALTTLRNDRPGLKLELEADTQTNLGNLMHVWDAIKQAGFEINEVPARVKTSP